MKPAPGSPQSPIDRILKQRRVVVTCGTGGVGKTTVSSALALRAAMLGRKAIVITIDPAKRLATSLGLETLGDHPTDLTSNLNGVSLKITGKPVSGTLAALMPDTRRTFETFVAELAPNPAVAERVMRNPIFQIFAREFSGTNEYMALEKLHAIYSLNQYDCIILDTPPSRNTLAFLDAPKVLAQFFDEKLIRWLVLPANKIVAAGMKKALGILEKLTGAGFMTHLFDFASSLFEVRGNFTRNLTDILKLLESDQVGFIMVTTPSPGTAPEADHFVASVQKHHFHFDGIAINRTFGALPPSDNPAHQEGLTILRALQRREEKVIEKLSGISAALCAKLPELARDVHSVEDLFHVAMALGQPTDSGSEFSNLPAPA